MNTVLAVTEPQLDVPVGPVADEVARVLGANVRSVLFRPWSRVLREAARPEVAAIVMGQTSFRFGSFLSHVAAIERPIVRVPAYLPTPYSLRRVLVPMVGDPANAASLARAIEVSHASDIDVVVLHVAEAASIPSFDDQTSHETQAWAEEFLARYVSIPPEQVRFEFRVGDAGPEILQAVKELTPDLVALGWGGRSSPGRARVVRRVLSECEIPVLLVPLADRSSVGAQAFATSS